MQKRDHWLVRSFAFILKWGFVAILILIRFIARLADRICTAGLDELGIKPGVRPQRSIEPKLKLVAPEWIKEGKSKDGMQLQRNSATGAKRLVVERTGQVLNVEGL